VKQWGWDEYFEALWKEQSPAAGVIPARITAEHRDLYILAAADGEHQARLSGRFRHETSFRSDLPAVGDWVAIELLENSEKAVIHRLLPRRSKFSRKVPGRRVEEQVVAANLDTIFLVMGLDGDFNVRRIERYLVLSRASGAARVIVLTKSDLHADCGPFIAEAQAVASGAPVIIISNLTGSGFPVLEEHLVPGRTVALLGSSGAGKSSIINRLLGCEKQAVLPVRRNDSRGRHATTHRELFALPNGALMIDNPGLRELQLWETEGLEASFPDIYSLAEACRFRDCRHEEETGCAVREALKDGRLPEEHFAGYVKLRKERAYLERKMDIQSVQEHKKRWKKIDRVSKEMKRIKKEH
jgi:ribosome biogenesis GTPase / thiamine phosphate phosphatase